MTNKIGLDFGTSFSTMSFINPKTNAPEIIFVNGHPQTETIVYYGEHSLLAGKAAARKLENATEEDRNIIAATFTSVKRHLLDPGWALPYDDGDDNNFVEPGGVVADFIEYMKKYAEEHCFHEPIESLRLTYPVAFRQSEKRVLEEAAKEAGFSNVEMLHEPVAAALGCAAGGMKLGKNILVYDLGAGTFDLALICRDGDDFDIPLEPMGTTGCAGDDFDRYIYLLLEKQLEAEHGRGFSDTPGGVNKQVLLKCRKVKEDLTNEREVRFAHFLEDINVNFKSKISRIEFEDAIRTKVDRTIEMTREMLKRAKDEDIEVDTFILIGGATLTPLVRQQLQKLVDEGLLPVSLTQTSNANTAVALGAVAEKNALRLSSDEEDDESDEDVDEDCEEEDEWDEDDENVIVFPDDVSDLQRAINRCPEGGTVRISPGKYRFGKEIDINKTIFVSGGDNEPRKTVLEYTGKESFIIFTKGSATLSDLSITSNGRKGASGIDASRWKTEGMPSVSNCHIYGWDDDGIWADKGTFDNCVIRDCSTGVTVYDGTPVFSNCKVYNTKRGFTVYNGKPLIRNCQVFRSDRQIGLAGMSWSATTLLSGLGITKGPQIENCTDDKGNPISPIYW